MCRGHPRPTQPDRDLNSAAPASFVSWVGLLAVPVLYSSYPDKERPPNEPIDRSIPLVLLIQSYLCSFLVPAFASRCEARNGFRAINAS